MSSYIVSPAASADLFNPPNDLYRKYFCPQMFTTGRKGSAFRKDQETFEKEVLQWCLDAISEGEGYLKGTRGFEGIEDAIDSLIKVGRQSNLKPEALSTVYLNEIKRDIWENCAILSNIKPSTLYDAKYTQEESLKHHVKILNNLNEDWYETNFVSNSIRGMNQWAFTAGTGYINLDWDYDIGDRGGEINPFVRGWADVLPVGLGDDLDLQRAYACVIKKEMDIRQIWRRWPSKAYKIRPDRNEPSFARKVQSVITGSANIYQLLSDSRKRDNTSPTVDVYYVYVDDFSINPLDKEIPAGMLGSHPKASWSYSVPALGEQFQVGFHADGQIKTRKANEKDARLYPNKRLIICTRTCILYDGPSFYWHGKYPVVKYSPDGWIWSYLGYSLAAQVLSLNESLVRILRGMDDAVNLQLDPPQMIDESIPPNLAKQSLRKPGMKIRGRLGMGAFMKQIVQDYRPAPESFQMLEYYTKNIARQLGTPDLRSLQEARQIPGSDTAEKYFAAAGAIVTDMSMCMDKPLWEMADMNRYNFFQFYDLPRRLRLLGKEGFTKEDLDFDPINMIPASLPGEKAQRIFVSEHEISEFYASTRMQRAKVHLMNFSTTIERTSAHEITSIQNKLMKFQFSKINPANGMISRETLAKEAGLRNYGTVGGETELEKIRADLNDQKKIQLQGMIQEALIQLKIQQAAQEQSPQGQMANAMQSLAAKASEADRGGEIGARLPGRPPEFNGAPQLEDKGDRSTITGS